MSNVTALRVETISSEANQAQPALRECVSRAVKGYLADAGNGAAVDLYRLVLAEVEAPLLAEVLQHCKGNISHTAGMLGITRTTLRKKLGEHGIS